MAKRKNETRSSNDWLQPESAGMRGRTSLSRQELRKRLPEQPQLTAQQIRARRETFPERPEIEYERSVIRIPFYLKGAAAAEAGRQVDVMVFDAFMRLIREAPIRNGLGYRQFEFYIDAWELTNTYSAGLNANVTFTLSDTEQPKSLCVALQQESDYPALIIYNAIYDVYLGSERIVERQPGTATARPVREIPPRNVTVAFEKPFSSDLFEFAAGSCEGMRSITRAEFEMGAREAKRIRGQTPAARRRVAPRKARRKRKS
jgi:hypothetical protein